MVGPLTDASGVVFTAQAPPRRIVSLIPSVTETLFSLGLGEAVVGVTTF
jgi:iron complex transport system substrate-binding protein